MLSVISASTFLHSRTLDNHENTTYTTSDSNTSEEQNLSTVSYEQENITHQTNTVNTKIEQSTGIVSKVEVGAVSTKIPEDLDYNETVIIDTEKLNNSAKDGTINLILNDENIEIIVQKSGERNDGIWYKGFTKENPDYNVDITIRGDEVYGSIDTYDKGYTIFPTKVVVDGEIIHVVTISDILNSRLELEKYPVDPLTFEIINGDNLNHEFAIEVFDPYNKSIFKESYSLQPGETMNSPEVSEQLGLHHYVYSLDNGESLVLYVRVGRSSNLGSSEKASFEITNDTTNPLLVSTTIA
ncbi:MAG: hypothetical protein PWQ51_2526 [Methanolobus sp.]|uniref:hypothetical protein n=1 Tax=Methanolobus sp. TaxID=1874737 RepID=UPI00258A8556|nr:hypothetical protein [Methanolobus sp.]MDK2830809.1 hypothetical protein [Methanolobus sp.]MDK2940361.1 hypothetical protein [Methanolobus sp.]